MCQADGQTDGPTSCHGIVRAMHTCHAVKTRNYDELFYDELEKLLNPNGSRMMLLFRPTNLSVPSDSRKLDL